MSLISVGLIGLIILSLLEAFLQVGVRLLRRSFQWLITAKDLQPIFEDSLIEKYEAASFHPSLGWSRKPNTWGVDQTSTGEKKFRINWEGARLNPGYDGLESNVSVFGDSYAFCRLAGDSETWPHLLSKKLGINVRNFGVGNYGLDQAYLRYLEIINRQNHNFEGTQTVIFCVVPETIVRIHSRWKHFFEYGNILAFKPSFALTERGLTLSPSPLTSIDQLRSPSELIETLKREDYFFERKFLKDMLKFPFVWSFCRAPKRHFLIIKNLILHRLLGDDKFHRDAFDVVLSENLRWQKKLYGESGSKELLKALIGKIRDKCEAEGSKFLLVIIPQPLDLVSYDLDQSDHVPFFAELSKELSILDLTPLFAEVPDRTKLYVEGTLGPHLSSKGNNFVASRIQSLLR